MVEPDIRQMSVKELVAYVNSLTAEEVLKDLELLKPQEVAPKLRLSDTTVYHQASRGELPGIKLGGALRFRPKGLYLFLLLRERQGLGAAA